MITFIRITKLIKKKNFNSSPLIKIWKKIGIKPLNVVKDEKKAMNNDLFDLFMIFWETKMPNMKEAMYVIKKILLI